MSRAIINVASVLAAMKRKSDSDIVVIGSDGMAEPIPIKANSHHEIYVPIVKADSEPSYTKFNSHFKRTKGRS